MLSYSCFLICLFWALLRYSLLCPPSVLWYRLSSQGGDVTLSPRTGQLHASLVSPVEIRWLKHWISSVYRRLTAGCSRLNIVWQYFSQWRAERTGGVVELLCDVDSLLFILLWAHLGLFEYAQDIGSFTTFSLESLTLMRHISNLNSAMNNACNQSSADCLLHVLAIHITVNKWRENVRIHLDEAEQDTNVSKNGFGCFMIINEMFHLWCWWM